MKYSSEHKWSTKWGKILWRRRELPESTARKW